MSVKASSWEILVNLPLLIQLLTSQVILKLPNVTSVRFFNELRHHPVYCVHYVLTSSRGDKEVVLCASFTFLAVLKHVTKVLCLLFNSGITLFLRFYGVRQANSSGVWDKYVISEVLASHLVSDS